MNQNWPDLADALGRFLFVLDEGPKNRSVYLDGHPSLRNRVMFVSSPPGNPEAAFLILNDPVAQEKKIQQWVKAGYLVRTRADANTQEARRGDYTRFEAALRSGAHFISTDYYQADPRFQSAYSVQLPNGFVARCNPINPSEGCEEVDLER